MEKNNKKTLIIIIVLLFFFLIYAFITNVYAYPDNYDVNEPKKVEKIYYKNSNPIVLEDIIGSNTKSKKSEKIIVQDVDLEYQTLYKENNEMPSGTYRVVQMGEEGKQSAIIKQVYEDENLISEKLVSNNVINNSTEKIIEIGTGEGILDFEIKEGDNVYVSANNLKLRGEPDINSKSIRYNKI